MPIRFDPLPGTLVRCDYDMGGFRPPEMTKVRPAVVVSPRLRHRDKLCAVVPLSGSYDGRDVPYIVRIELKQSLPPPYDHPVMWAKCDMIATVSFERIDLFRTRRDQTGKRQYLMPRLGSEDLQRVQRGILFGLGLGNLTLTGA
jgi:mRNA interferase MazF